MLGEFWTPSSVHFNIEVDWFTNADCKIVKFSIKIFIFKEVQIELEWSDTFVESPFVHFWFENIIRFDDGFKSIVTAEIPFDWSRECQTSKWTRCVMSCWWNRKCICVCDKVFAFSSSLFELSSILNYGRIRMTRNLISNYEISFGECIVSTTWIQTSLDRPNFCDIIICWHTITFEENCILRKTNCICEKFWD